MEQHATGVLDKDVHRRLLQDLDHVAEDAGIDKSWVAIPMGQVCRESLVRWVRRFKFHPGERRHSVLVTCPDEAADDVCGAVAGALLRNFIRVRVMTLHELVTAYREGEALDATCVVVPRCAPQSVGSEYQRALVTQTIFDVLGARRRGRMQTMFTASSERRVLDAYGPEVLSAMGDVVRGL